MTSELWTEKYRPTTLEDILLPKTTREYLESLKEKQEIPPHLLLLGSPGIGKTSLAKIIATTFHKQGPFLYVNASEENGVDNIRIKVLDFCKSLAWDGGIKWIILDEMDRLSKAAQQILRNVMEVYADNVRFILTGNYSAAIIEPLKSRCVELLVQPSREQYKQRLEKIIEQENLVISEKELENIIKTEYPDLRKGINILQGCNKNKEIFDASYLAREIVKKILNKQSLQEIRQWIIDNTTSDISYYAYLSIMRQMFELFCQFPPKAHHLTQVALPIICEFMYRDPQVLDKEINFYHCLITLSTNLPLQTSS